MPGTPSANVIIVDPVLAFHAGIRAYLAHGGYHVVGEAQDPADALRQLKRLHPDLAIIGPHLAEHESLALCRELVAQQRDLKVILISEQWRDPLFLIDAAYSWASACLRRRVSREDFLSAINAVLAGHTLFPPDILAQAFQPIDMSAREREVLGLMVEGKPYREIAAALVIQHRTARNHAQRILGKLGVHSRREAMRRACRRGWV
ncbi:MAG: hypothetical protein C4294_19615 [Nitrospiraceae bacterium]